MWRVCCSETGWLSRPYPTQEEAEAKASSIDRHLHAVMGVPPHTHEVVEIPSSLAPMANTARA